MTTPRDLTAQHLGSLAGIFSQLLDLPIPPHVLRQMAEVGETQCRIALAGYAPGDLQPHLRAMHAVLRLIAAALATKSRPRLVGVDPI